MALLIIWGLVVLFGWHIWPRRMHTIADNQQAQSGERPAPLTHRPSWLAPQGSLPPKHYVQHHLPAQQIPSIRGDNNTFVNATPSVKGSNNTVVGGDKNGNTILTRDGVGLGSGASADQSSIAIGANAHAGDQQRCEPGSLCNQNTQVNAPQTVINTQPPPATLYVAEEAAENPDADGLYTIKVHLKTDRAIPGAVLAVKLSGRFEKIVDPLVNGSGATEVDTRGPVSLRWNGQEIANCAEFRIDIPAAFTPSMELVAVIKSKTPIHVIMAGVVLSGSQ